MLKHLVSTIKTLKGTYFSDSNAHEINSIQGLKELTDESDILSLNTLLNLPPIDSRKVISEIEWMYKPDIIKRSTAIIGLILKLWRQVFNKNNEKSKKTSVVCLEGQDHKTWDDKSTVCPVLQGKNTFENTQSLLFSNKCGSDYDFHKKNKLQKKLEDSCFPYWYHKDSDSEAICSFHLCKVIKDTTEILEELFKKKTNSSDWSNSESSSHMSVSRSEPPLPKSKRILNLAKFGLKVDITDVDLFNNCSLSKQLSTSDFEAAFHSIIVLHSDSTSIFSSNQEWRAVQLILITLLLNSEYVEFNRLLHEGHEESDMKFLLETPVSDLSNRFQIHDQELSSFYCDKHLKMDKQILNQSPDSKFSRTTNTLDHSIPAIEEARDKEIIRLIEQIAIHTIAESLLHHHFHYSSLLSSQNAFHSMKISGITKISSHESLTLAHKKKASSSVIFQKELQSLTENEVSLGSKKVNSENFRYVTDKQCPENLGIKSLSSLLISSELKSNDDHFVSSLNEEKVPDKNSLSLNNLAKSASVISTEIESELDDNLKEFNFSGISKDMSNGWNDVFFRQVLPSESVGSELLGSTDLSGMTGMEEDAEIETRQRRLALSWKNITENFSFKLNISLTCAVSVIALVMMRERDMAFISSLFFDPLPMTLHDEKSIDSLVGVMRSEWWIIFWEPFLQFVTELVSKSSEVKTDPLENICCLSTLLYFHFSHQVPYCKMSFLASELDTYLSRVPEFGQWKIALQNFFEHIKETDGLIYPSVSFETSNKDSTASATLLKKLSQNSSEDSEPHNMKSHSSILASDTTKLDNALLSAKSFASSSSIQSPTTPSSHPSKKVTRRKNSNTIFSSKGEKFPLLDNILPVMEREPNEVLFLSHHYSLPLVLSNNSGKSSPQQSLCGLFPLYPDNSLNKSDSAEPSQQARNENNNTVKSSNLSAEGFPLIPNSQNIPLKGVNINEITESMSPFFRTSAAMRCTWHMILEYSAHIILSMLVQRFHENLTMCFPLESEAISYISLYCSLVSGQLLERYNQDPAYGSVRRELGSALLATNEYDDALSVSHQSVMLYQRNWLRSENYTLDEALETLRMEIILQCILMASANYQECLLTARMTLDGIQVCEQYIKDHLKKKLYDLFSESKSLCKSYLLIYYSFYKSELIYFKVLTQNYIWRSLFFLGHLTLANHFFTKSLDETRKIRSSNAVVLLLESYIDHGFLASYVPNYSSAFKMFNSALNILQILYGQTNQGKSYSNNLNKKMRPPTTCRGTSSTFTCFSANGLVNQTSVDKNFTSLINKVDIPFFHLEKYIEARMQSVDVSLKNSLQGRNNNFPMTWMISLAGEQFNRDLFSPLRPDLDISEKRSDFSHFTAGLLVPMKKERDCFTFSSFESHFKSWVFIRYAYEVSKGLWKSSCSEVRYNIRQELSNESLYWLYAALNNAKRINCSSHIIQRIVFAIAKILLFLKQGKKAFFFLGQHGPQSFAWAKKTNIPYVPPDQILDIQVPNFANISMNSNHTENNSVFAENRTSDIGHREAINNINTLQMRVKRGFNFIRLYSTRIRKNKPYYCIIFQKTRINSGKWNKKPSCHQQAFFYGHYLAVCDPQNAIPYLEELEDAFLFLEAILCSMISIIGKYHCKNEYDQTSLMTNLTSNMSNENSANRVGKTDQHTRKSKDGHFNIAEILNDTESDLDMAPKIRSSNLSQITSDGINYNDPISSNKALQKLVYNLLVSENRFSMPIDNLRCIKQKFISHFIELWSLRGIALSKLLKWNEAIFAFHKALEYCSSDMYNDQIMFLLGKLSKSYQKVGNFRFASRHALRMLILAKVTTHPLFEYKAMCSIVQLNLLLCSNSNAIDAWSTQLECASQNNDFKMMCRLLSLRIDIAIKSSSYTLAVNFAKNLLQLAETYAFIPNALVALRSLAICYLHLGQYKACLETIDDLEKALGGLDMISLGEIYRILSQALVALHRREEVVVLLEKWLYFSLKSENWVEVTLTTISLGTTLLQVPSRAREYFIRGLEYAKNISPPFSSEVFHSLMEGIQWLIYNFYLSTEPIFDMAYNEAFTSPVLTSVLPIKEKKECLKEKNVSVEIPSCSNADEDQTKVNLDNFQNISLQDLNPPNKEFQENQVLKSFSNAADADLRFNKPSTTAANELLCDNSSIFSFNSISQPSDHSDSPKEEQWGYSFDMNDDLSNSESDRLDPIDSVEQEFLKNKSDADLLIDFASIAKEYSSKRFESEIDSSHMTLFESFSHKNEADLNKQNYSIESMLCQGKPFVSMNLNQPHLMKTSLHLLSNLHQQHFSRFVLTYSLFSALEVMETALRFFYSSSCLRMSRPPRTAVTAAFMQHPDKHFIFYFSEYQGSTSFRVLIRPAYTYFIEPCVVNFDSDIINLIERSDFATNVDPEPTSNSEPKDSIPNKELELEFLPKGHSPSNGYFNTYSPRYTTYENNGSQVASCCLPIKEDNLNILQLPELKNLLSDLLSYSDDVNLEESTLKSSIHCPDFSYDSLWTSALRKIYEMIWAPVQKVLDCSTRHFPMSSQQSVVVFPDLPLSRIPFGSLLSPDMQPISQNFPVIVSPTLDHFLKYTTDICLPDQKDDRLIASLPYFFLSENTAVNSSYSSAKARKMHCLVVSSNIAISDDSLLGENNHCYQTNSACSETESVIYSNKNSSLEYGSDCFLLSSQKEYSNHKVEATTNRSLAEKESFFCNISMNLHSPVKLTEIIETNSTPSFPEIGASNGLLRGINFTSGKNETQSSQNEKKCFKNQTDLVLKNHPKKNDILDIFEKDSFSAITLLLPCVNEHYILEDGRISSSELISYFKSALAPIRDVLLIAIPRSWKLHSRTELDLSLLSLCGNHGYKRIIRFDIEEGYISAYHVKFVLLIFEKLDEVLAWPIQNPFATALRLAQTSASKNGFPLSVWNCATLIGVP